jgi:hypothetical protein
MSPIDRIMVRFHPYAVGLLAIAAMLTIAATNAFALTRETPLETAQRIEALTAGGYFDPTNIQAAVDNVSQRDARLR